MSVKLEVNVNQKYERNFDMFYSRPYFETAYFSISAPANTPHEWVVERWVRDMKLNNPPEPISLKLRKVGDSKRWGYGEYVPVALGERHDVILKGCWVRSLNASTYSGYPSCAGGWLDGEFVFSEVVIPAPYEIEMHGCKYRRVD